MKHLKTILAILFSFALLASTFALAEELPYMQQLTQDRYINLMFLTTDSYPEVCIGQNYYISTYIPEGREPYYVHFACPPNTYVANFNETSCTFIDTNYNRQYSYMVRDSAAFETFINKAAKDEYILADGSDGVAIYIEPDRYQANALISARDIGKDTKLQISIYDDSLKKKNEQQIIDALSPLIINEATRVHTSMRIDLMSNYWSAGHYAGFKQICDVKNSNALVMTYTLPEGFFISEMDHCNFTISKLNDEGDGFSIKFDMDTASRWGKRSGSYPSDVSFVEINGMEYRYFTRWSGKGKLSSVTIECTLADNVGFNNTDTLYLSINVTPLGNIVWSGPEALLQDWTDALKCIQLDYNQNIPDYHDAPSYSTASTVDSAEPDKVPAVGAPAGDEAWVCAECGNENNGGKFCPNCGSPRPEEPAALVCSNCGYVVPEGETPKFCAECGNPF